MRNPSGGPRRPKASKDLRRSQGELGMSINLALQRLNTVVAAELGHLAESLHNLREENSRLREQLSGSAPEQIHFTCGPIAVVENFLPRLPCFDRDLSNAKGPFQTANRPMSIKCLPPVKPAVTGDQPISDGTTSQGSCYDQHAEFRDDGKDSAPFTSHGSFPSQFSSKKPTHLPEAPEAELVGTTLSMMPNISAQEISKKSTTRSRTFELLPIFDSKKDPRLVSKLGVTQTDHSFQRALIMLEKENQGRLSHTGPNNKLQRWIISPVSPLSIGIDILAVILILFDCAAVPLLLLQDAEAKTHFTIIFMSWLSKLFWTLAIPRAFITGYLKEDGRIETNIVSIARKYAQSWLIFDVAVVLTDWLESNAVGVLRIIRLTKVVRLARMSKVPTRIISQFNYANSERMLLWFTILKSMFTFVLVNHFLACVWFWVGTQASHNGWVSKLGLEDANMLNKYTYSVHWSTSQFEGSTEIMPKSSSERAFGAIVMLLAFIWSASFVSNITAAMTRLQLLSGHKAREVAALQRFLADSKISGQLAVRVLTSANFLLVESEKNQAETDVKLLEMLSLPMLNEIHYEMHSGHLMQHPFFWYYNVHEPLALQKLCHSAVKNIKLGIRDVLFAQGEKPTDPHMFFVLRGTLFYIKDFDGDGNVDPDEMAKVTSPMWVCEPVLWLKWTHVGNLRAATNCSILALSAEVFREIISEYITTPYPAQYAAELVSMMNAAMKGGPKLEQGIDDLLTGIDVRALVRQHFPHYLASTRKLFTKYRASDFGTQSSFAFKSFQ